MDDGSKPPLSIYEYPGIPREVLTFKFWPDRVQQMQLNVYRDCMENYGSKHTLMLMSSWRRQGRKIWQRFWRALKTKKLLEHSESSKSFLLSNSPIMLGFLKAGHSNVSLLTRISLPGLSLTNI
jgi:hypothetical protein